MSGKIKSMIDTIIVQRSKGNPLIAQMTKTKLILKNIDPGKYTSASPDEPEVIQKLIQLSKELNITL